MIGGGIGGFNGERVDGGFDQSGGVDGNTLGDSGSGSDTSSSSSSNDSGSDSDKSDDDGIPPPLEPSPRKRKVEQHEKSTPPPAKKTRAKKTSRVKGARSSYLYYCEERRPILKAEDDTLTFADLAKILGLEWKALNSEDRKKFVDRAGEDRRRYVAEKGEEAERIKLGIEVEAPAPKAKKVKKKKGPKKGKSAYMCFCMVERPQLIAERPGLSFSESGKIMGARWKALNGDERSKYNILAEEDKARFVTEKAEFDAKEEAEAAANPPAPQGSSSQIVNTFDEHIEGLKAHVKRRMLREDITESEMESAINYMVDQSPYEVLKKLVNHASLQ